MEYKEQYCTMFVLNKFSTEYSKLDVQLKAFLFRLLDFFIFVLEIKSCFPSDEFFQGRLYYIDIRFRKSNLSISKYCLKITDYP